MTYTLHQGDCLETLRTMPDNSVDSIVTDPPYGLSFMGRKWDYDVPSVEIWAECLRVLKPGGHLLAFAGTRTQHRMAVRIEDAGFEIRDMIAWVYGCLDAATEVATEKGVMPYHKTKIGDRVLCYDVEHGEYTYQPILEIVEYDYSDTAYRLVGDFGEQVVSRNHRVIVEHGGSEAFQLAETLECEARVPVLESLPALRKAVHDAHKGAGRAQQDVRRGLCKRADRIGECRGDSAGAAQGRDDQVCCLRGECLEAGCVAPQSGDADVQPGVQRCDPRRPMGDSRTQGSGELVGRGRSGAEGAHDRRIEPGVEGRVDVPQAEGRVCGSADQVRALPCAAAGDGAVGRLCDGAPHRGGASDWSAADADGVRSPHQPRCDGQPSGEPDVVCDERAAQGVRAWGGHRSAVVRIVPFHYTGKVWCLRVPTGAFVAVRNGVAFPTGNSGFPKSMDVSKAIDKAAGAERTERLAPKPGHENFVGRDNVKSLRESGSLSGDGGFSRPWMNDPQKVENAHWNFAPATEAARQWQGWGTALKPALEPITVARKPLAKGHTVAANVLAHGTGAINVDGCRVVTDDKLSGGHSSSGQQMTGGWERPWMKDPDAVAANAERSRRSVEKAEDLGRWPANLIHDGSEEVLAGFPAKAGAAAPVKGSEGSNPAKNTYGEYGRVPGAFHGDTGSAARFFYCAKASKRDRDEGNIHPTVKPTDLMRYLCRLVTPPGGVVLDPFMGSGSTGKAARLEGFRFVGCELSAEYLEIARARIEAAAKASNA